ncbi:MAG: M20 family metallo-hydrolase [Candidatus Micrarchaeaceae archaeon]
MPKVFDLIDSYKDEVIKAAKEMIPLKAISPSSGGSGESARADYLQKLIEGMGFKVKRYSYKDDTGTERPNLVSTFGAAERRIWIIAHMDTVSEGDLSLWEYEPFKATVVGDRIYGRGINDDGQDVIAGIYAMKALKESGDALNYGYGLAIVADEELGSVYGIQKLIGENIFGKGDLIVVPDGGTAEGDEIEVAEKGILWVKVTVTGKQVHASTPEKGANAYRASINFLSEADKILHSKFNESDQIFSPPTSTFEMTKHEKNTDSVNIIPGKEVSYIDCRVLPKYSLSDVMATLSELAKSHEKNGIKIKIEQFNREDAAPPTDSNSAIAKLASSSVRRVLGCKPKITGVGGGTCAAFFRHKGIPAVVWSKKPNTEHSPNEYAIIGDILADAKVFADMCINKG